MLLTLNAGSVDAIVTDPPYGLRFMNAHWDYDIPSVEVWRHCHRVMKPGSYLLSFASPRTQHRMATNIEDAGFEIKDVIGWMYAQGMPKSGGLKPAWEPITIARKPGGRVPFNIDDCRVDGGRYPANLIVDGSDAITALFPNNNPGCKPHRVKASDECVANANAKGWGFKGTDKVVGYDDGDNLSAARFYFCAKATKEDRGDYNEHLTVKPLALMRYLVRLVTPEGGKVVDPYMGSGSTGKACVYEGYTFVGSDTDASNVAIARRRINEARQLFINPQGE